MAATTVSTAFDCAKAHDPRELDERTNNGITVQLWWDPDTDRVSVYVHDASAPQFAFATVIPSDRAAFAFAHPYLFEPADVEAQRLTAHRALYAVTEDDAAGAQGEPPEAVGSW